jgi:hypothetical protein
MRSRGGRWWWRMRSRGGWRGRSRRSRRGREGTRRRNEVRVGTSGGTLMNHGFHEMHTGCWTVSFPRSTLHRWVSEFCAAYWIL